MTKREFGGLELAILQLIKPNKKVTVREVCQLLGNKDKYNTIMTVMYRLSKKGVLERERTGIEYHYWQKESFPSVIKKKLVGVKPFEIMSYLFESAEAVSDDELSQMEALLEKMKKERAKPQ